MTPEEYLAFEQAQELRHELVDGYLYAMTGSSDRHEKIALNLAASLRQRVKRSHCRVYKGDLKIRFDDDFCYPDVFVRCGDQRGDPYFKTDPLVIAEVLSPGTQRYDRGDKRLAYSRLPTLKHYVLIAQDRMCVELYAPGDYTNCKRYERPEDMLRLEAIDFSITLAELYA